MLLSANFIVATAHRAARSLKFENKNDEISRTAGRHFYSHSLSPNRFCLISMIPGVLSDSDYSDYSYSTGYPRFCYHLVIN